MTIPAKIDLLGITDNNIYITEGGLITANIFPRSSYIYIGTEATEALIQYVKENGKPFVYEYVETSVK